MCGRYLINAAPEELRRWFAAEFSHTQIDLRPRFNVAPTQAVPIVRGRSEAEGRELRIIRRADGGTEREIVTARWGLVPGWAKDLAIGNKMINARAETVVDKPAFRSAFKARRCIVPASGFYEWKRLAGGRKQPHLIRRRDGAPMGFAGLWEVRTDRGTGEVLTTCTIITTTPNEVMAELHDRMPVILDPADYDRWLDPTVPGGEELLCPCPAEWLETVPVSTRVNSPRNDGPDLVQPVEEGAEASTMAPPNSF